MNRYHVMKSNQLFPYYQVLSIKNNDMSLQAGGDQSNTISNRSLDPQQQPKNAFQIKNKDKHFLMFICLKFSFFSEWFVSLEEGSWVRTVVMCHQCLWLVRTDHVTSVLASDWSSVGCVIRRQSSSCSSCWPSLTQTPLRAQEPESEVGEVNF